MGGRSKVKGPPVSVCGTDGDPDPLRVKNDICGKRQKLHQKFHFADCCKRHDHS